MSGELVEFLLARITDDETFAEMVSNVRPMSAGESRRVDEGNSVVLPLNLALSPARVLAECEAKRLIVADCAEYEGPETDGLSVRTLLALAAVYAEHPDYRQEWRP